MCVCVSNYLNEIGSELELKRPALLKLDFAHRSPKEQILVSDSGGVGWGLRICISSNLPDGADATRQWPHPAA